MIARVVFAVGLILMTARAAGADSVMTPFVIPGRLPSASQLNAKWIETPAGRNGHVVLRDGHFYTGDRRIRFLGANVVYEGCFPAHDEADALAIKLSRLGVNLVRFHFLDAIAPKGLIDADQPTTQQLDEERLARLDYFIAKLKENGVYCDLNLYCGHEFTSSDGVSDPQNLPSHGKYVTLFDRRLIELQKDFARKLLLHKNPHTGSIYAQEPAVALIEITNENSFFYGWSQQALDNLLQAYAKQLDDSFAAYLNKKGLPARQRPKWNDKSADAPVYMQFLAELEQRYFREMYGFLKHDLQVASLVTGTMAFGPAGAAIMAETDFVDNHAYWQHPIYSGGSWTGSWTVQNTPMAPQVERNTLLNLEAMRVDGKPYTVSEYNHAFPSLWDAEAVPLSAAFAARCDWDGLMYFSYNSRPETEHKNIRDFFQLNGHPVKTAQLLAASAILVRGDVPPAENKPRPRVDIVRSTSVQATRMWWDVRGMMAELGLPMPTLDTDNQVFHWRGDGKTGLAIVNTAASKSAVGFFDGEPMCLGGVAFSISSEFAAVMATALDDKRIDEAKKILITACGRSENTGMKWNEAKNSTVNWGTAPALTECVEGTVELPGEMVVFALDSGGAPAKRVVSRLKDGRTSFAIGPDYSTVWYLAIRK